MKKKLSKSVPRDEIYRQQHSRVLPFIFDENVAHVFDDMIARSVPLYGEVQKLCGLIAQKLARSGNRILDLGCSTGSTLIEVKSALPETQLEFYGIDNSEAMLNRCRQKLSVAGLLDETTLIQADLESCIYPSADLVFLNYTLQFIQPVKRLEILNRIHTSMYPAAHLIISEKITHKDVQLTGLLNDLHLEFKRAHGYSDLEISQKRDALENILIPLSLEDNIELLKQSGFEAIELVFKSFNFITLVARKHA